MSENERRFPKPEPARLTTIRSLDSSIKEAVRLLCLVVESRPGAALVQDVYDTVDKAASIRIIVEGTLEVGQKYILIGTATEKTTSEGTELMLNTSLAYNVDSLDIKLYKEALEMESGVLMTSKR